MKTLLIHLLALGAFAAMASADSIPVNRKTNTVNVPHVVISLHDFQRDEIAVLGTLTLTEAQWKPLREIAPRFPKRFQEVVPITYSDGEPGFNAIQIAADKVAIIYSDYTDAKNAFPVKILETVFKADYRGQFYRWNELIPFPRLLQLISDYKPDGNLKSELVIAIVLPVGAKTDDDVFRDRLKRIREAAQKVGLGISVNGIAEQPKDGKTPEAIQTPH